MEAHAQMGPSTPKGPGERYEGNKRKGKRRKMEIDYGKQRRTQVVVQILRSQHAQKRYSGGIKMQYTLYC